MSELKNLRRARRAHRLADVALHGRRQRRRRRAVRRRPPRLCAAGRRRHRLRGPRLDLGRRLRHRLRQHGGAHQPQVRGHQGARAGRSPTTSRKTISFGLGRTNPKPVDHAVFDQPAVAGLPAIGHLKADGARAARHRRLRQPLCRPVRGRGRLRLDRRAFRLARARPQDARRTSSSSPAARTASTSRRRSCDVRTASSAQRYLAGMTLAGEYAYAGREWVVERVRRILVRQGRPTPCTTTTTTPGASSTASASCGWCARARRRRFPGQRGFVGGSMGDDAVILSGVESEDGGRRASTRPCTAPAA